MGNRSNVPQSRRYQQGPLICCGEEPRRQPLDQASPNVMNVEKYPYGRFSKAYAGSEKNSDHVNFEETGETYYNKDITILRRPGNQFQGSPYKNPKNNIFDHQNMSKDSRDMNPLRPITQQESQLKKSSFASFKKSTYGAYNSKNANSPNNSYGMHAAKDIKENLKQNLDPQHHKPYPTVDFVGEKQKRQEIKKQKKNLGPFVGDGKYGGRVEEFQNNKRIVMFLQQNYIKEPQFKFYDTKDNSSLLNNSTIMVAKKKRGKIEERYLDQNSTSNLKLNQNLSKLQDPIELTFQIDARIILATCMLIIGIIVLILGATVFYSDTAFFICLIIFIILYVCYALICYIYSDVLQYFSNTRSFEQFQQDYKKLRLSNGQLAYHIHLQTPKTVIKECYLLSKVNKYTRIEQVQNQNRQISIEQLKDKQTSCVFIKYKTKTSFFDAESQLNTINYFDDFLEEQKNIVFSHYQSKSHSKNKSKKASQKASRGEGQKQKRDIGRGQQLFKKSLKKSDFGYELDQIEGISKKQEQVFNVCYMQEEDGGCYIMLFVVLTLLGLCLPFLCFFEAYTKRYRINLLNRFKINDGRPSRT